MEVMKKNELLMITNDQFVSVRKTYNVTQESLSDDVDAVINWFQLQPHLPDIDLDREWVERIIISNKCSLERSKQRLEMIFSARNMLPEFFLNKDPLSLFKNAKDNLICLPLPRLAKDNTRVFILKFLNANTDTFDFLTFERFLVTINEYRRSHDYCMGDRYIWDVRNQTLGHMVKFYPSVLRKAEFIFREVNGYRIAGIHMLFVSPVLEKVVTFLKSVLSAKLSGRITVHQNLESLHETITREIFPKDYSGDEKPFNEMIDDWEKIICSEKQVRWSHEQEELRSDESRRPPENESSDSLGIAGSFRQLRVD